MLKAFILEFDNVLVDLNPYRQKAWIQVFEKLSPNFKISDALLKKLSTLTSPSQKVIFWDDFKCKCDIYPQIGATLGADLLHLYDEALLNIVNNELTEDCLNLNLIEQLKKLKTSCDTKYWILNTTKLSDLICEKLQLIKKYPLLNLFFTPKALKPNSYLETIQYNFKNIDVWLEYLSNKKLQTSEVIVMAHNTYLVKSAFDNNCFLVGVNNNLTCYCNLLFNLKVEEIDLDQVVFSFFSTKG